jgi:hypothetical protein
MAHVSTALPGMKKSTNITNTLTFSVLTLPVTFAWDTHLGDSPKNL